MVVLLKHCLHLSRCSGRRYQGRLFKLLHTLHRTLCEHTKDVSNYTGRKGTVRAEWPPPVNLVTGAAIEAEAQTNASLEGRAQLTKSPRPEQLPKQGK